MDRVFDQHVKHHFQGDRYGEGIEKGVLETIKRIDKDWSEPEPSLLNKIINNLSGIFLFGFVAVSILANFFWSNLMDILARYGTCPKCGQRTLDRSRQKNHDFGPLNDTEVVVITRCTSCDYHDERRRVITGRRHDGHNDLEGGVSGGGSFGGGGSSGGGGGGRW